MNLDIRLPIGLLFLVTGLLLTGYGLATRNDAILYRTSLGYNVNLWWGLVMLAFGVVMAALGRRRPPVSAAAPTTAGAGEAPRGPRH